MIDVLVASPAWVADFGPVISAFVDALDPSRFDVRVVRCAVETKAALDELGNEFQRCSNPVVIAGYAQGAAVAGDLAAHVADHHDRKLLACALMADPFRPSGRSVDADPGGYGIAGKRSSDAVPIYWSAAPGDMITAMPAEGMLDLRRLADLPGYFALSNEKDMHLWAEGFIDILIRRQLRKNSFAFRSWHQRSSELGRQSGTLFTRNHIDDYVRHGHARKLGELVNRTASQHMLRVG